MQDPILRELRRSRAQYLKEMERDIHRFAMESNDLLYKVCDVVISPTGERQLVASKEKMYNVLIAPRQQIPQDARFSQPGQDPVAEDAGGPR